MASVTGMTQEAIDAALEAMVVSVRMSDTGRLLYKNKAGVETDGGPIVAPSIAVDKAHPVGSIFIHVSPTNPNTLLGIGTWIRFGQGRVLVSQYSSDFDFDTAEELGGVKTVTLTAGQSGLPYHAHSYSGSTSSNTVDAQFVAGNGQNAGSNPVSSSTIYRGTADGNAQRTISSSQHAHSYSGNTSAASANAAEAHTNLQPYIVVYMWKRTA